MSTQTVEYKVKAFKARNLAFFFLLALLLTACSSQSSRLPTPAAQPASPQEGSHPPVILRVEEREEVIDGSLYIYQDIYFTDPDGDAAAMTYQLDSSSLTYPLRFTDDPIRASPGEQKTEALFTVAGRCWQKLELTFESRVRDQAGNMSEAVPFVMSCTAPQPLDTSPFLVKGLVTALPIALVLLLGFWLLFRKHPLERLPALRSMLLIACLFMLLRFIQLVIHEGGHALYLIANRVPFTLYVHPFILSGFSRPIIDNSIWKDILGSVIAIPVCLIISLPFWKRRSVALLPLVMLFPYTAALLDGINVMGIEGDFRNLVQVNGLPAAPFFALGALIVCVGLLSMFSLLPLAGLDPRDNKALFVLPTAMFLTSVLSFLVAHLFVPGSPIDQEYFVGREIIISANSFVMQVAIGLILAILYITLFRRIYPRLPAWLRTETASLSWKDLCIPAILWSVSVVIGLIVII